MRCRTEDRDWPSDFSWTKGLLVAGGMYMVDMRFWGTLQMQF